MKKLLLIYILLRVAPILVGASGQESIWQSANQSYSAGNYAEAANQYELIINSGYESSELYFNLGNAYFKQDQIPSAILYYEKARKLDPNDENIKFNLELANSRIVDKMEPLPEFFLRSWWKGARDIFSSNRWAGTGIFFFIITLVSFVIFIISIQILHRKVSFWAGLVFLSLMLISFLFSYSSYHDYSKQKSGIIFSPTVTVKSSPNEGSVDLFVIHEGTKVLVTDRVENWSEVKLANGNVGWVRTETFLPI
jgi:tetratricopeptide (TPR) repeat protein